MRIHIKKRTAVKKLEEYNRDTLIRYIIEKGTIDFCELNRIEEELHGKVRAN